MSIFAIFVTMLLVSMNACNARQTPGLRIYIKAANNEVTKESSLEHKIDAKETFSGHGISTTTSDEIKSEKRTRGSEGSERSMLQSESEKTKEPTDANEEESVEDAVVMDYVTPHRKSPIHNNNHRH